MVRDSVQLETAVNTIFHEYLLEFTSEYGIPEMLHPELPRPGDKIVDFPEGKAGKEYPQCYTKPLDSLKNWNDRFFWVDECVFPTVVDWRTNASKDGMPASGTYSVEAVRALDTHQMDLFSLIRAPNPTKVPTPEDVPATAAPEVGQSEGVVAAEPPVARESRKRGHDGIDATAPPKSLRRDHDGLRPSGAPADVSDPDPLSFADAPSHHPINANICRVCNAGLLKVLLPPRTRSLRIFLPLLKLGLRKVYNGQNGVSPMVAYSTPLRPVRIWWTMLLPWVAHRDQRIQARESEIKNLEALLETEVGMKRAAEEKSAGLSQELERMRAQFSKLQVSNERLSQQVDALQQQVSGKETLKAAFEEYKRQQDQLVEQRCAEMDARLDALSIDFDEELYPHMLTAIAGCAESLEMRQAFADVVSVGVAKGISEGLKHGVEHGHAQLTVESLEVYDPEAEAKFTAALQSLKDLNNVFYAL
nr:hypothetical protein [Tanacetum cinerariifolium]